MIYKLLETNSDILSVNLELQYNPIPLFSFFLFWHGYDTSDFSELLELLA